MTDNIYTNFANMLSNGASTLANMPDAAADSIGQTTGIDKNTLMMGAGTLLAAGAATAMLFNYVKHRQVKAEPKPEVTAEPKPEVTAEPKSEVTAEPKPEVTAEPKPEVTAEPKPEVTAESKPADSLLVREATTSALPSTPPSDPSDTLDYFANPTELVYSPKKQP